jgi:hypothetical protein
VQFRFNTAVTGYDRPHVWAGGEKYSAARLMVCSGEDVQTLYPETLSRAALVRCKLQMMRSAPRSTRIGPMLAAGLTLRHYQNFRDCPSLDAVNHPTLCPHGRPTVVRIPRADVSRWFGRAGWKRQ